MAFSVVASGYELEASADLDPRENIAPESVVEDSVVRRGKWFAYDEHLVPRKRENRVLTASLSHSPSHKSYDEPAASMGVVARS